MVILESLSCGCPVIGTSASVIGDLYESGLEGVFLYEEIKFEQLRQLCNIYRNPEKKMLLHDNMERYYSEKVYKEKLNTLL